MQITMNRSVVLLAATALTAYSGLAQTPPARAGGRGAQTPQAPMKPLHPLDESYLIWPVAPADKAYTAIDGNHLKQYVEDQAAMSRRYRDQGHQFWGRIIGTSADEENAQWMLDKFKQFGLTDVHEQMFDLPPQWMPQSWSVSGSRDGKIVNLLTAQPTYQSPGTSAAGLDLEAVYVGQGSDAEFNLAPDVRGKAVF